MDVESPNTGRSILSEAFFRSALHFWGSSGFIKIYSAAIDISNIQENTQQCILEQI